MDKNIMSATLGSATPPLSIPTPHACAQAGMSFAAAPAAPGFKTSRCVDAELLLSTPLTVVVCARLDYAVADGTLTSHEVALVIPRSRCQGDHPYWPALLAAAQEHWHRCPGHAHRLLVRVHGEWQTILSAQMLERAH
ncbi:hypothetical protein [Roseateles amylovorans]|uniref:Uncharacterized protein n=1 Tax=Roseateles amylovorans TaxID=2978473 RepID=A0ABY6B354_9BURK|nr:hypothetical protein [Roseateles amylovorans]UXH78409.1 hypothetical protein N4261_00235 [Roseateles amylovorans]